jgi:drug/metabolite transporter (DMT)-like permease
VKLDTALLTSLSALAAAALWGAGDFTSGIAARRAGILRTVLLSYSVGLAALAIVALAGGEKLPHPSDLGWGALGGLAGMAGLGFLLRGFSSGRMGIVAPVSALLATVIPVVFDAFAEGLPGNLQLAGFGLGMVSVWLLSRPEKLRSRPQGLGMAVLAGLGFAGFFIATDQVSDRAVFWPLIAGRAASCGAMLLFALLTRRPLSIQRSLFAQIAMAGVLDVGGNLFFLLATQYGRLDVAAVLGSLYPAVTALLAWLVVRESLARPQVVGVGAAILAIVLITI